MDANEKKPYADEGYALVGAAYAVHKEMGGGLLEEVYQESLEIELGFRGIPFQSQQSLNIFYKDQPLKKTYIPDLVAFNAIIVGLKAVLSITPEHEAQLLNYMRITKQPIGYFINFAPIDRLVWKRFLLSQFLN
jgi:GxxExxY protein